LPPASASWRPKKRYCTSLCCATADDLRPNQAVANEADILDILVKPIGSVLPVEAEAPSYAQIEGPAFAA